MGVITFNGIASDKLDIQVEHPPGYETPKKDYEIVHVPGRNGDVYIDKGSYQNVSRTYDIAMGMMYYCFRNYKVNRHHRRKKFIPAVPKN